MKITTHISITALIAIMTATSAYAGEGNRLSVEQAKGALTYGTFDCTMAGGVAFRLYFPDEIDGDEIDYRFRMVGETDRRPMTYQIKGEKIVSARDGEEREIFDLGGGDLRIARPSEDGATCRRDQ